MQLENAKQEDYQWIEQKLSKELQYLSNERIDFFNKNRKNPSLYKLEIPTQYDDSMFVVFLKNDDAILYDDIEELFAVGKLRNNKLSFNGNFTSLNDAIKFIQNKIKHQ